MSFKHHITNVYGSTTYKTTAILQRLKTKSATSKNQMIFLLRCLHHRILPKSFKSKPVLCTEQGRNITFRYNLQMLQATANSVKKVYHSQLSQITALTSDLKSTLSDDDFESLMRITDSAKENIFKRTRDQLKDKFEQLRNTKYGNNDGNKNSRQETIANELKLVKPAVLNLTQK